MAHPVCWPSTPEFDPVGLDPAMSLTQDLSPEQSADILLLGCGDPRHILYTLSTDVTCPHVPRKLDITCCDIEPAVLARNIILFTLLEDDTPSNHVWDIFYHFKLTDHTYNVVTTHSRKLANLAESLETWRLSKYGSFIKMVDASSLSELRDLWVLYADFTNLSGERLDRLHREQTSMSERVLVEARTGVSYGLSRSAAGMWNEALGPVNEQFVQYWERGTTSATQKEIKKTTRLNPTFCYSRLGETFAIYDHSFPQGFHFAPAFTPLVFDPAGPATNSAMTKSKQQFKAGCMELQASRKAQSITFRFFAGDALSFCRALDLYNKTSNPQTREFTSPWRGNPIDLTEHFASSPPPPVTFDVIDSSDLSTDLGLFNILLATQPLLKKQPASQAILYTDLGLEKRSASKDFQRSLHCSVSTAALLLGLVPRPYVSLFTSTCVMHMFTITELHSSFVERIAWVDPMSGDQHFHSELRPVICAEPFELIILLANIYREMTEHDSPKPVLTPYVFSSQLRATSEPHFTRETFAILVSRVKSSVERIAWVNPTSGDRHIHSGPDPVISAEPFELIRLLVNIYREMTEHDSPKPVLTPYVLASQLRVTSEPHFTRETFAILVSRVKSRVHLPGGDWAVIVRMIRDLLGVMDHDSGLITHIRDLEVQFRLHDLPVEPMVSDEHFRRKVESSPVFRSWTNVPRLVCVTFIVPSGRLDPIRGEGAEPWPRLVCELGVDNDDRHVTYSSIQAVWGKLIPFPVPTTNYLVEEDPEGFRGTSDLVVSFWADADILASRPYVSLCLRRTQLVVLKYCALGPRLQLFTTRVGGERVHVFRERPMTGEAQPALRYVSSSLVDGEGIKCQLVVPTKGTEGVESLHARIQVDKTVLGGIKPVITQLGPCTLEMAFGNEKKVVAFPYPVRNADCKFSVNRITGWVDVSAPILGPTQIMIGGYPASPFPILQHAHPSPWNVHHLYIDRMPKVDIQQKSRIRKWLIEHTTLQMSDRERIVQQNAQTTGLRSSEILVGVKEMIASLVQDYAGIRTSSQGSITTFGFTEPTYGLYLVIFVGGLRLDLAGATLALECAIVPVSPKTTEHLSSAVTRLESETQVQKLQKTPAEAIAWKHLIPAFVERIRTWPHRVDCEYKAYGEIPLNKNVESDPLCTCGCGIGFSGPEWQDPAWKELLPNATRAAISPLFGVSILEAVAGSASKHQDIKPAIPELEPVDSCWKCGATGRPLLICIKCKRARYCSKDCQVVHWKEHKRECQTPESSY
ncbi:unnamed protein product [Rhizoctonia solani]|uniref:MYND-type domain-containing protein n=1 Tax=Rhizoctonia solani TaxID=456999 RepID=A0A8H3C3T5_9AGAM|nr:unnamed protein product [Rhizoctonia solani]